MSKLSFLLELLGIGVQPLTNYLAATAETASLSVVHSEDPVSYKNFVSGLFVGYFVAEGSKHVNQDYESATAPPIASRSQTINHALQNVPSANKNQNNNNNNNQNNNTSPPTKNLSSIRLMNNVAEYLISTKGSHEENSFVSGFGYRWVFDRGDYDKTREAAAEDKEDAKARKKGHCHRPSRALAAWQRDKGNSVYGASAPKSGSNIKGVSGEFSAQTSGSHFRTTRGSGSNFRLERGSGEMSLAFFTTANWRILHARLGDDLLFTLLSTKMIFATSG